MLASPEMNSACQIRSPPRTTLILPRTSGGSSPSSSSGPNAHCAQLGVRQIEVVLALEHVIGELVAERVADPARPAVVVDHVEHRDLGLLAAVQREAGHGQRLPGRRHDAAVALVEPLGRDARPVPFRSAALQAEPEHLHRVAELVLGLLHRLMHGIARLGAAEMGQPGAGHQAVRRIGMVERGEHAALGQQIGQIEDLRAARGRDQIGQLAAFARRLLRQLVGGAHAGQRLHAPAVVAHHADPALAGLR